MSELLGQFWNRWKREYLVDLREHHRLANEGASVAQSVLQVILSPKWKKESQIVVLGNVKGLRRCILETMVSLEELLWKVHGAVAKETFCKNPYKNCFR